jgi:hypothetical protein
MAAYVAAWLHGSLFADVLEARDLPNDPLFNDMHKVGPKSVSKLLGKMASAAENLASKVLSYETSPPKSSMTTTEMTTERFRDASELKRRVSVQLVQT